MGTYPFAGWPRRVPEAQFSSAGTAEDGGSFSSVKTGRLTGGGEAGYAGMGVIGGLPWVLLPSTLGPLPGHGIGEPALRSTVVFRAGGGVPRERRPSPTSGDRRCQGGRSGGQVLSHHGFNNTLKHRTALAMNFKDFEDPPGPWDFAREATNQNPDTQGSEGSGGGRKATPCEI